MSLRYILLLSKLKTLLNQKFMKQSIYIIILFYLIISCVDDFNATLPFTEQNLLIVEGDIIEGETAIFYLNKDFSLDATQPTENYNNVDANVYLIDSNGNKSTPAINVDKGTYQIKIGHLDIDIAYGIEIVSKNITEKLIFIANSEVDRPYISETCSTIRGEDIIYGSTTPNNYMQWDISE